MKLFGGQGELARRDFPRLVFAHVAMPACLLVDGRPNEDALGAASSVTVFVQTRFITAVVRNTGTESHRVGSLSLARDARALAVCSLPHINHGGLPRKHGSI